MWARSVQAIMICILGFAVLASPAYPIDFVGVKVGIRPPGRFEYPCPLNPEASRWAATDWGTSIVITMTNINEGDEVAAEVTAPTGKVFRVTSKWAHSYKRGCSVRFVPILGTDAGRGRPQSSSMTERWER